MYTEFHHWIFFLIYKLEYVLQQKIRIAKFKIFQTNFI